MNSSSQSVSVLILFLAVLTGCEHRLGTDYSQITLLDVHGKITLDRQPLTEAVVVFEDMETGTFSAGITDFEGKYTLRFDSVKEGCTPGKKRIDISTTRKILGLNTDEEGAAPAGEGGGDGPRQKRPEELVPKKYNKDSELTAEVSKSAIEHNFELTSK